MRRTRIVATLGPASSEPRILRALIEAGVDVFRLNFSHSTREAHRATIQHLREMSQDVGREVAILQDLCGPKIRVGEIAQGSIELVSEMEVTLTPRQEVGTGTRIPVSYKNLPQDVSADHRILLDEGRIALEVLAVANDEMRCRVIRGGTLRSRKGINLPGTPLSTPSVTAKDMRDLAVGLEEGVDFIALSFVRKAEDVYHVRRILDKHKKTAQIIAKIEKPEAVQHLDEIIAAADGILIARGDLGIEMDLEAVPLLQKEIIRRANEADKYVITATQMLESMTTNPSPTRAEVADVANAIIDGTDAVMLSGETAVGAYPVEAVKVLDRIARVTENYLTTHRPVWNWTRINPVHPILDSLGHAALQLTQNLQAKAIVAFSPTGGTALFLSKSRPFVPIVIFTDRKEALRRMRLFWGVVPVWAGAMQNQNELREQATAYLRSERIAKEGERFLLILGSPFGEIGSNHAIEIVTLEEGKKIAKIPTRRRRSVPSPRRTGKKGEKGEGNA